MNYKNITTPEAAFKLRGYEISALPKVDHLPLKFQKRLIADYILSVIVEAMNTDENGNVWEPDYNDKSQRKYELYVIVDASKDKPGGFALSGADYAAWYPGTGGGSRLCFDKPEKVYHFFEHFKQLHVEHKLILK